MRRTLGRATALLCAVALLSSCAVSSATFYQNQSKASDLQLCKTARSQEAKAKPKFRADVLAELRRRGVDDQQCNRLIQAQRAAIAAGIAAGALAYAAAQDGGGSGGGGTYYAPNTDHDWDWDFFYDEYGRPTWACRGIQTGRFAELRHCQYDVKDDNRWPTTRKYF